MRKFINRSFRHIHQSLNLRNIRTYPKLKYLQSVVFFVGASNPERLGSVAWRNVVLAKYCCKWIEISSRWKIQLTRTITLIFWQLPPLRWYTVRNLDGNPPFLWPDSGFSTPHIASFISEMLYMVKILSFFVAYKIWK